MENLGTKGRAVDAVLADASAHHDDSVAGSHLFRLARHVAHLGGKETACAAEDQRLAGEATVKNDGPIHIRNPRSVGPIHDSTMNPTENSSGMKQRWGEFPLLMREAKTENIRIEDKSATHPGAKRIAVHTDDTGQGTAIRIERARGVMCFYLDRQVIILGETESHPRCRGRPTPANPSFWPTLQWSS